MLQMHTVRINAYAFFAAVVCGTFLFLSSALLPRAVAAASLTIADGVTVQAGAAGQLVVRDTLIASKSTLTSCNDAPAPGDWLGLLVLGSASGSALNGTVIEYVGSGGYDAGFGTVNAETVLQGQMLLKAGTVKVRNVRLRP